MSAIRITGTLARDAEARFATDGTASVCIEVLQPGSSLPFTAQRTFDNTAASGIAARSMAAHLRRGSHVTVHAGRYDIALAPTPHLVLFDVDRIEHQPITPRHEPRSLQEHAT
jgi:hypothetical protein